MLHACITCYECIPYKLLHAFLTLVLEKMLEMKDLKCEKSNRGQQSLFFASFLLVLF